MNVFVFGKIFHKKDFPYIQIVFDELFGKGFDIFVFGTIIDEIRQHISLKGKVNAFNRNAELVSGKCDVLITLGGDGTILEAATLVKDSGVPIMGLNLGRLGFLASIEKRYIKEAIESLDRGMYQLEQRTLLYLESNLPIFGENSFALNDCTFLKRDSSSMVIVHTFINGDYLNSYWADGLIISTPTGSTGYSLSCGGPIVFPNSGNFVITPVAPHNLNVRPIVVSDSSVVSIEIEGRAENFLCTLDSRFEMITKEHQIAIRKCDFTLGLVRLHDHSFLRTIRDKLAWGVDLRN